MRCERESERSAMILFVLVSFEIFIIIVYFFVCENSPSVNKYEYRKKERVWRLTLFASGGEEAN